MIVVTQCHYVNSIIKQIFKSEKQKWQLP